MVAEQEILFNENPCDDPPVNMLMNVAQEIFPDENPSYELPVKIFAEGEEQAKLRTTNPPEELPLKILGGAEQPVLMTINPE